MDLDVAVVGGVVDELYVARGALEAVGAVKAVVGVHVTTQRPFLPEGDAVALW